MKKLFCIVAALAMVIAMFAVPASADVNNIKIGTPDIDGVLDDIYLDSAVYEYKASEAFGFFLLGARGGEKGDPVNIDLNVYILYDRDYVYFCVVGYDDDPYPVTQVKDVPREEIQYQNDHYSVHFTNGDELAMIKGSHVAEFDMIVTNAPLEDVKGEIEVVGSQVDGNFVIEWAVPYKLVEGDILKVNVEVADRLDPEDYYLTAYGCRHGQGYDACDDFFVTGEYAVAAGEVEEPDAPVEEPDAPVEEPDAPVEEPDAPVEEPDAPVEEPDAPVEEPEVPDTFDASAIMYILSAVSVLGMGLVINKRK